MPESLSQSNPGAKQRGFVRGLLSHLRRRWWVWYLALVLLSHVSELIPRKARDLGPSVEIGETNSAGPIANTTIRQAYQHWSGALLNPQDADRDIPILLLHGSPGDSGNFGILAPMLANRGYTCYAPDLPGFGGSTHWIADYSVKAHAHAVLAMMDELQIERAHVIVWSMGGGVSLNMADIAPDRVASITLMAAIGAQETEGSGDFLFEHAKYALGYLGFVVGGELVPLPWHRDRWSRHSWIRNFFDTDQRPLGSIMQSMQVPTLILQGRHDFLVPYWAAERHHELIETSELVMFNSSHFIPVTESEAREATVWIVDFLSRVEANQPIGGEVNLAPVSMRTWPVARLHELALWIRSWHWIMQALLFAALARLGITPAIVVAGLLRATESVNLAVSLVGILALRLFSRDGPRISRPDHIARSGLAIWALSFAAWIFAGAIAIPLADRLGGLGMLAGILGASLVVHVLRNLWTTERRQCARASLARICNHEFWPMWVFYAPLVPWLCLLAVRHRSPLVFTCANPGISHGGGVTGESKIEILNAMHDDPQVLEACVIAAGPRPGERAVLAQQCMQEHERLSEFPVVLKPLAGERGIGVHIAHSPDDLGDYFAQHNADTIIQQYHPGPIELGVLWARSTGPHANRRAEAADDGSSSGQTSDQLAGRVVSVTIKDFPSVLADGKRTIRQLILGHPRFRCQAGMFMEELGQRSKNIPPPGERVDLGGIGNHARGAIFRDAPELITPALSQRIDEIARLFKGFDDGELDFGRFDVRVSSLENAACGQQLAIVELNGVLAESTNLYDPAHSVLWAYGVLFAQWAMVFRLGAHRRTAGASPMPVRSFLSMIAADPRASSASTSPTQS